MRAFVSAPGARRRPDAGRGPSSRSRLAWPLVLPRQRQVPAEGSLPRRHRGTSRWVRNPSPLSSSRMCPAPPVGTRTRCATALQRARPTGCRSAPTRGTLPGCGVWSTHLTEMRTGHHAGGRSPSQVSGGRLLGGHVASGRYPTGPTPRAPGSRRGTVCAGSDFSGPNLEAPGYPPAWGVRGLAPSPPGMPGKPSRASRG